MEPKFYAVRAGHNPGIYHTWSDCLEQVRGFKKALCEMTLFHRPHPQGPVADVDPHSQVLSDPNGCRALLGGREPYHGRNVIV